jgi:hypothetical protein
VRKGEESHRYEMRTWEAKSLDYEMENHRARIDFTSYVRLDPYPQLAEGPELAWIAVLD